MSNYILLFYVYVITYARPNLTVGFADLYDRYERCPSVKGVNVSRPERNGQRFADDIFNGHLLKICFVLRLKFQWSLLFGPNMD